MKVIENRLLIMTFQHSVDINMFYRGNEIVSLRVLAEKNVAYSNEDSFKESLTKGLYKGVCRNHKG